jgi:hypothetical protein
MKTGGLRFARPGRESDEGGLFVIVLIKAFSSFTATFKKKLTVSSCFRTYAPLVEPPIMV